jgi:hypothetical protein
MLLYSQPVRATPSNLGKMTQIPPKPRKKTTKPSNGPQRTALETTIEALRTAGRLEDIDDARVQIARGLASAVDAQPDNPTIWREYRAAEKALREESENHADPFDQLIASIASEVGNTPKQKAKNARP